MFSVVVVSHGHVDDVIKLLSSLEKFIKVDFEVIIVDNLNSNEFDVTKKLFSGINIKLVNSISPYNFSRNYNQAVMSCEFEKVILLNPDIELFDMSLNDVLSNWKEIISDGFYYPRLLNSDFSKQSHSKAKPNIIRQFFAYVLSCFGIKTVSKEGSYWFYAAAILFNKTSFYKLGGFDERFPMYAEDVEFCHRARALGFSVKLLPQTSLIHGLGNDSKGKFRNKALYSHLYLRFKMVHNILFLKKEEL
ncbi:glycosyltransferase family 2 protein [Vibrio owensii]